jgi:hypothetical protein
MQRDACVRVACLGRAGLTDCEDDGVGEVNVLSEGGKSESMCSIRSSNCITVKAELDTMSARTRRLNGTEFHA